MAWVEGNLLQIVGCEGYGAFEGWWWQGENSRVLVHQAVSSRMDLGTRIHEDEDFVFEKKVVNLDSTGSLEWLYGSMRLQWTKVPKRLSASFLVDLKLATHRQRLARNLLHLSAVI